MKKRIFCIILAVICAIPFFQGCNNKEHKTITIMDAQRDYRELIKLVKEKYPEINIEVIPYRGGNMSAYTKQQLETGIMPDIYSTTQSWDFEYQRENLLDLFQYDVSSLYEPARLTEYFDEGSLYLLPFDYSITGIICNKTLFEENNIEIPTSFNELKNETIPALNKKDINISNCLLDLPGSAFQYFFNVTSTMYMNTTVGREWRTKFADVNSNTFASGDSNIAECVSYFQEWIDCGMMNFNSTIPDNSTKAISEEQSNVLNDFYKGNTAFMIGAIKRFSQNDDGTGDQYVLIPYLSKDGKTNNYITSTSRLYGLNKDLGKKKNKQKLQDCLHVLEVLSTVDGYEAINGKESTYLCSLKEFSVGENSPYKDALAEIGKGHSMNLVYTGYDNYLVPFGEAVCSWIKKSSTGDDAIAVLDKTKKSVQEKGVEYYATCTETLSTAEAAQLTGQMFLDQVPSADAALISYNIYSDKVHALNENSYGANGQVLPGKMTAEYITTFLPTGWYGQINTATLSGATIKELANTGCDVKNTGVYYPYVFMTRDGKELDDNVTYTVIICGYTKTKKEELNLSNTGVVGLDAAKAYLKKIETISKKTLDKKLLISITDVNN